MTLIDSYSHITILVSLFMFRYVGISYLIMANSIYQLTINNNKKYLISLLGSLMIMFFGILPVLISLIFCSIGLIIYYLKNIKDLLSIFSLGSNKLIEYVDNIDEEELKKLDNNEKRQVKFTQIILAVFRFFTRNYQKLKTFVKKVIVNIYRIVKKYKIDKAITFILDWAEFMLSYLFSAIKVLFMHIPYVKTIKEFKSEDAVPKLIKNQYDEVIKIDAIKKKEKDKSKKNDLGDINDLDLSMMMNMMSEMNDLMKHLPPPDPEMMKIFKKQFHDPKTMIKLE